MRIGIRYCGAIGGCTEGPSPGAKVGVVKVYGDRDGGGDGEGAGAGAGAKPWDTAEPAYAKGSGIVFGPEPDLGGGLLGAVWNMS